MHKLESDKENETHKITCDLDINRGHLILIKKKQTSFN